MNYVVDKVKEEQKEDVSILTHPQCYLFQICMFIVNSAHDSS